MVLETLNVVRDPDVRERADRERDAAVDEELGDGRVIEDREAMIDPLDAQDLDVEPDRRRRTVLALVRGERKPDARARR